MPGKVNPVIPEATVMACAQVIGHHTAITVAGQTGNFQLNVTLPLIAYNLLDSITLLGNVSRLLAATAIAGLQVRQARVREALDRNPILVTALNPIIGYEKPQRLPSVPTRSSGRYSMWPGKTAGSAKRTCDDCSTRPR